MKNNFDVIIILAWWARLFTSIQSSAYLIRLLKKYLII